MWHGGRVKFATRGKCTDLLHMWVIFMDISAGQGGLSCVEMEGRRGGLSIQV
jgi:hypothetical protein